MALIRLLFRRSTPCRVRLMVLANMCAFCFVVGMTLVTSALAYFFVVPFVWKGDEVTIQAHRSVIVYLFFNVVGNFILCFLTDTSTARLKIAAKGRHSNTSSTNRRQLSRKSQTQVKEQGSERRSEEIILTESGVNASSKPSGTVTHSVRCAKGGVYSSSKSSDTPKEGSGCSPVLNNVSEDRSTCESCPSEETNQTGSSSENFAYEEGKAVSQRENDTQAPSPGSAADRQQTLESEPVVEAQKEMISTPRKTHLPEHEQVDAYDTPGSKESMRSGTAGMEQDLSTDFDSKTSETDKQGAAVDRTGLLWSVRSVFAYFLPNFMSGKLQKSGHLKSNAIKKRSTPSSKGVKNVSKSVLTAAENDNASHDVTQKDVSVGDKNASHRISSQSGSRDKKTLQISKGNSTHKNSEETGEEPVRSHYCILCEKTILKRDHHCFFMTVCVGYNNHKHFIFFCLYMMVGTLYGVVLFAKFLNVVYKVRFTGPQTFFFILLKVVNDIVIKGVYPDPLYSFFVYELLACLLVGLAASGFFFWHSMIAVSGQTTHEATTGDRRFNQGRLANIRDVFGLYWPLLFLLPLPLPQAHDGAHYVANPTGETSKADDKSSREDKQGKESELREKKGENRKKENSAKGSKDKKNAKVRKRKN